MQYRRNSPIGTRNLSQEVPRILSSRYDSLLQKGFTGHLQHLPELFLCRIFAVERNRWFNVWMISQGVSFVTPV
jgi:hypothetical protein